MYIIQRCVPIVWRSETCAQFGVDDPVLIDGLSAEDIDLLTLLRSGIHADEIFEAAQRCGVSARRVTSFLALLTEAGALAPVDCVAASRTPLPHVEALAWRERALPAALHAAHRSRRVSVTGPLAAEVASELSRAGMIARTVETCEHAVDDVDGIVVLTAVWTADLLGAGVLNEAGVEHLHLTVGQAQSQITAAIVPGQTPCTGCRVAAAVDSDSGWVESWRALRRTNPSPARLDPILTDLSTVHVANAVRSRLIRATDEPRDLRIHLDGSTREVPAQFHDSCDCRLPLAVTGLPTGLAG